MKFNILLLGAIGSGKTESLRSIVEECGKELFVIATEPGIPSILGEKHRNGPLPLDKCHWHYVSPGNVDWNILSQSAKMANTMSIGDLQKSPAPNRNKFQQFIELYATCANFKCERDGCMQEFGAVDSWGEDRVLAIDGLSGISQMALDLIIGSKFAITQPEWGAAMRAVQTFLRKCCSDTKCSFVLLSHEERQLDETHGGTHITVSTLGNKLAPELVKPFDEIIYSKRVKDDFYWSTIEPQVDLKTRVLGWGDDFKPTFKNFFSEEVEAQEAA